MNMKSFIACTVLPLLAAAAPALAFDPIISIGGQHLVIHPGGGTQEVLATSAQTGGAFAMTVTSDAADSSPGMIVHANEAEIWYVLEGTFEFRVGDKVAEGGPGTFVAVDKGQPHTFKTKTPGKLLMLYAPGGFEQFFIDWEKQGLDFGPELGALEASYGVTRP
jgi:mannose-6-phosphate isomerase-like protein (cupin superfamily)